jgi:hypothetical protein
MPSDSSNPEMWVYCLTPIDWWTGAHTVSDYESAIVADHGRADASEQVKGALSKFRNFLDKAKAIAPGWEGDIREGPFVLPVPPRDPAEGLQFMVAWKQENNGTTFLASPFRLPWLEEDAESYGEWIHSPAGEE